MLSFIRVDHTSYREIILMDSTYNIIDTLVPPEYGLDGHEFQILENGNYIFSLSGGGYIVAGTRQINNWDDLLLMKVNNDGTQSSSWNFGGSYNEVGNYAQEVNGGYFISGFTESFGRGLYDAWIIKIDGNGNEIYDHTFGGNLDDKVLGGTNSLAGTQ